MRISRPGNPATPPPASGQPPASGAQALPDTENPSGLCPRCGLLSSFETHEPLPLYYTGENLIEPGGARTPVFTERLACLKCRHCHQGVAVVEEQQLCESPEPLGGTQRLLVWRGVHWWPLPAARLSADVPQPIAEAFAEAVKALHADCPRAAAAMARRALEAVASDMGESDGRLVDRLHALANRGLLQPVLAEWAGEVRLLGNAGAHFDPIVAVSSEDAQQLLDFLRELLRYLYELPADLARRRANRV